MVRKQGAAYTRRCTRKAVCGHRRTLVIEGSCATGPRVERSKLKVTEGLRASMVRLQCPY